MKWPSLNLQILLGAVFGIALGAYFHDLGASHPLTQGGVYAASLLGTLFIDLLKMVLIPLVFCSIAVGIANLRQHQQIYPHLLLQGYMKWSYPIQTAGCSNSQACSCHRRQGKSPFCWQTKYPG